MQCTPCLPEAAVRSKPRGWLENTLYVWGADIRRCLKCNARTAFFWGREISLVDPEIRRTRGLPAWIAIAFGIFSVAGVAVWILWRFHRL